MDPQKIPVEESRPRQIQIIKALTVEASIENILDADYSYYEGYPEEGRNFYVSLKYLLTKE